MFPTARISPLASMLLPTAKETPKIFPACIAAMSKEADPTVPAPDHAAQQVRANP
jgi:hypothetical protein